MSFWGSVIISLSVFFFFNDTATTEIYTLSLHDALPIWRRRQRQLALRRNRRRRNRDPGRLRLEERHRNRDRKGLCRRARRTPDPGNQGHLPTQPQSRPAEYLRRRPREWRGPLLGLRRPNRARYRKEIDREPDDRL